MSSTPDKMRALDNIHAVVMPDGETIPVTQEFADQVSEEYEMIEDNDGFRSIVRCEEETELDAAADRIGNINSDEDIQELRAAVDEMNWLLTRLKQENRKLKSEKQRLRREVRRHKDGQYGRVTTENYDDFVRWTLDPSENPFLAEDPVVTGGNPVTTSSGIGTPDLGSDDDDDDDDSDGASPMKAIKTIGEALTGGHLDG